MPRARLLLRLLHAPLVHAIERGALHGAEACRDRLGGVAGEILGRALPGGAVDVRIEGHLRAHRATEEAVDGQARRFARDVP